MMELFAKTVNVLYLLTISQKNAIADVQLGFKYASDFQQKQKTVLCNFIYFFVVLKLFFSWIL